MQELRSEISSTADGCRWRRGSSTQAAGCMRVTIFRVVDTNSFNAADLLQSFNYTWNVLHFRKGTLPDNSHKHKQRKHKDYYAAYLHDILKSTEHMITFHFGSKSRFHEY